MKMKTITILLAGLVFSAMACTQPVPPREVQSAFEKMFPGVQKVKWSRENDMEWEAAFVRYDTSMSSNFDNSGKWLETEKELKKKEFPASVMQTIHQQFPGYKLKEPEKIEKPGFSGYEAELEKGEETLEVAFYPDGTIKSRKTIEKDEDED